jgi:membrane-associated protease RseP (regulator of RpoE activity)
MRDITPTRKLPVLNIVLFLATLVTTTWAGYAFAGDIWLGLSFSLTIMLILLVHESGHYIASRYHKVPATLPYFIPAPNFIGTFGAVIRMKGAIYDRRALLDIGVSGPLAGFVVALPTLVIGFMLSEVVPSNPEGLGISLGDNVITWLVGSLVFGAVPEGYDVILHPVGFAGWLGMLVTALNLIPVGQLDGGHISMALFHDHAHRIARVVHVMLFVMGIFYWEGWIIWGVLLIFLGVRHPPVLLPHIQLDERRRKLGYLSLAVFLLTFIPVPFSIV